MEYICIIIFFVFLYLVLSNKSSVPTSKAAHNTMPTTKAILRKEARQKLFEYEGFCESREPVCFESGVSMFVDDVSKRIVIEDLAALVMISYGVIVGFDVKEDNQIILESKFDDALAGAIVGDLLLGNAAVGAVLGASGSRKVNNVCSSMTLGIKLNDIRHPYIEFNLIDRDIDKSKSSYLNARQKAREAIALLSVVERQQKINGILPENDFVIFKLFAHSNLYQPEYGQNFGLQTGRLTLCPNCFALMYYSTEQCRACGYNVAYENMENSNIFVHGATLKDRYYVGKIIGYNETTITYLGFDTEHNQKVFIKEYYPNGMVIRSDENRVVCANMENEDDFQKGIQGFLSEAYTLCNLMHLNIVRIQEYFVRVQEYFACNGTAYMIMEYLEGKPFSEYLEEHSAKLTFAETCKLLLPIMEVIKSIGSKGIVFNGISVDSIFITKEGVAKLFDLGLGKCNRVSAKYHNSAIKLTKGYQPPELYREDGQIGVWSDVYSIAAIFYRCLTGEAPQDAIDRLFNDKIQDMRAKVSLDTPEDTVLVILKALSIKETDRFKNISDFIFALSNSIR